MHIFHNWSRWSDVQEEAWERVKFLKNGSEIKSSYIKKIQTRTCAVCNKVEKRTLTPQADE
jgi:hypothetical protein